METEVNYPRRVYPKEERKNKPLVSLHEILNATRRPHLLRCVHKLTLLGVSISWCLDVHMGLSL